MSSPSNFREGNADFSVHATTIREAYERAHHIAEGFFETGLYVLNFKGASVLITNGYGEPQGWDCEFSAYRIQTV